MKFVPAGVSAKLARQVLVAKKHSPAIMFGAGITGAVTASVLACKATLKLESVMLKHEENRRTADYLLEQHTEDYTAKDYNKDVALVRVQMTRDIVKLYGPAVGVGLGSIALLTGAHIVLTKRNVALAAAYATVDKAFKEYRDRVRAELGDDKDREFMFGSVEKEVVEEGDHGPEVKRVKRYGKHSMYARVFDDNNKHWNHSPHNNRMFLQANQNYANDLLQSRGHVLLNDVYDALGMERSVAGSVVGWVKGGVDKDGKKVGDDFIDFGLFTSNDPVIRDFMNAEHNDGVMVDFNVDGVVNDLISKRV
jgi:hypothetical protein